MQTTELLRLSTHGRCASFVVSTPSAASSRSLCRPTEPASTPSRIKVPARSLPHRAPSCRTRGARLDAPHVAHSADLAFPLGARSIPTQTLFVTDEGLAEVDVLDARTLRAKSPPLHTCARRGNHRSIPRTSGFTFPAPARMQSMRSTRARCVEFAARLFRPEVIRWQSRHGARVSKYRAGSTECGAKCKTSLDETSFFSALILFYCDGTGPRTSCPRASIRARPFRALSSRRRPSKASPQESRMPITSSRPRPDHSPFTSSPWTPPQRRENRAQSWPTMR